MKRIKTSVPKLELAIKVRGPKTFGHHIGVRKTTRNGKPRPVTK